MNYKIIDNALPQEDFLIIKNFIFDKRFSWHLIDGVTGNEDESLPNYASYYFSHIFWEGFDIQVEPSAMFSPLLNLMECRSIMRIKANCYPTTSEIIEHEDHVDYPFSHKGAIFYLNTNNGLTIIEDEVKVESIENRLLLFDSSKNHRSTTCTDAKCRINVNFNFF